ncbi:hypothetical protein B0H13DRAFT_1894926 [Mycena leptocephala]|nr:hypothetical protein B0H13DRAFT_1894926 [Mycena leptocephala]
MSKLEGEERLFVFGPEGSPSPSSPTPAVEDPVPNSNGQGRSDSRSMRGFSSGNLQKGESVIVKATSLSTHRCLRSVNLKLGFLIPLTQLRSQKVEMWEYASGPELLQTVTPESNKSDQTAQKLRIQFTSFINIHLGANPRLVNVYREIVNVHGVVHLEFDVFTIESIFNLNGEIQRQLGRFAWE